MLLIYDYQIIVWRSDITNSIVEFGYWDDNGVHHIMHESYTIGM